MRQIFHLIIMTLILIQASSAMAMTVLSEQYTAFGHAVANRWMVAAWSDYWFDWDRMEWVYETSYAALEFTIAGPSTGILTIPIRADTYNNWWGADGFFSLRDLTDNTVIDTYMGPWDWNEERVFTYNVNPIHEFELKLRVDSDSYNLQSKGMKLSIPEPYTVVLMGLGTLALRLRRS